MSKRGPVLILGAARQRIAADYEAAATAGDVARRDRLGASMDALTTIMGDADVLAIFAEEIALED